MKVIEINSAYLQYFYVIFDHEFFKSGYMLSPQTDTFVQSIEHILEECLEEI